MSRNMIVIACLVCCQTGLTGQAKLSIERTRMLIGDQVRLTLEFQLPRGSEWVNQDLGLPDTLSSIETIGAYPAEITPDGSWQKAVKNWMIAPFDTGYLFLPRLPVILDRNGDRDTLMSNNIPIFVEGVVADSTGLAPIKDIIEEPRTWVDYLWVLVILGIAAVIYAAYRLIRPRRSTAEPEQEIARPPHEIALAQLDNLENEKKWQQGDLKGYYTELTHIFREYLENRYLFPALESTSEEIGTALKKTGVEAVERREVLDFLLQADMVKFAKATPPVEVHPKLLSLARAFILKTKQTAEHGAQEEEE